MTLVYSKLIFAILLFPLADNTIFLNVARCGRVKTVNYWSLLLKGWEAIFRIGRSSKSSWLS